MDATFPSYHNRSSARLQRKNVGPTDLHWPGVFHKRVSLSCSTEFVLLMNFRYSRMSKYYEWYSMPKRKRLSRSGVNCSSQDAIAMLNPTLIYLRTSNQNSPTVTPSVIIIRSLWCSVDLLRRHGLRLRSNTSGFLSRSSPG